MDEVRVAEKRVANMPRCRFARPAKCKSQRRENGTQTLLWWVFGCLAGVAICVPRPEPGRSNVLALPGKDLGAGCRSSSLPQVQLAARTNSPTALALLLLHVISPCLLEYFA